MKVRLNFVLGLAEHNAQQNWIAYVSPSRSPPAGGAQVELPDCPQENQPSIFYTRLLRKSGHPAGFHEKIEVMKLL